VLEVATARDLASSATAVAPLAACPGVLVGAGALAVLAGPPGSGKSTLAARVLDGTPGAVAYVSVEEAPGASVGQRLSRLGITRPDFFVVGWGSADQIAALVRQRRITALAIDSVQVAHWHARELRHLLAVLPSLRLVVAVSQVNKRGEIAGTNELLHEADVCLEVEAMRARLVKSRFQEVHSHEPITLSVLPSAPPHDQIRQQGAPVRPLPGVRMQGISPGDAARSHHPISLADFRAARRGGGGGDERDRG
jgi:predicted ATP-dependent serine protease